MTIAWHSSRWVFAATEGGRFDPGTGPGRYERARNWLEGSGATRAMAAFTFDPDEQGSVVVTAGEPMIPGAEQAATLSGSVDGRAAWEEGFARATAALADGTLEKVVLARHLVCDFLEPVDAFAVWSRLTTENPETYQFLIDGLVGASPELLVGVDRRRVESLALAGTAASSQDLEGSKLEHEHQLAADSVKSALRRHVEDIRSTRSNHRFGELVHAATRFEGLLRPGSGILDLLAELHPTAAVAGTPRDAAIAMIRDIEPPRGLYAGPVGWFDTEGNGEFAIALRCGRVAGHRVVLYAGGGLVAGSDLLSEWAETELKLAPMQSALGIDHRRGDRVEPAPGS